MKASFLEEQARFKTSGQEQVFAHAEKLDATKQEQLAADTSEIDLDEIRELVETLVKGKSADQVSYDRLEPAPYISHPQNGGDESQWKEAREIGEAALRAGKVAAFTVAGGQGTRLGYDGPKGTFPVTPVSGKPLFAVFAEKILSASNRYAVKIPWFIMTSIINHEATVTAFEEADYFGLFPDQVMFFSQGRMPAVDFEGRILLESTSSVAMSPDGHGGSLRALVRSGAIDRMKAAGIEAISYFQVDNPLVQSIDPAFIGFHLKQGSEMSSKMIPKAYPGEKVGHFCMEGDSMCVVEYSDMPMEMQEERDTSGELRFIAGSIAIHILSVGFVERLGSGVSDVKLPFHKAIKKIKTVDSEGNPVSPDEPNGIKFEMFVFDALPFARNPLVIETLREDDFSPVKNPSGVDSAETCRDDQLRQWARWLKAACVEIETDDSGRPSITFEVSPLFADSEAAFVAKWNSLDPKPSIQNNCILI